MSLYSVTYRQTSVSFQGHLNLTMTVEENGSHNGLEIKGWYASEHNFPTVIELNRPHFVFIKIKFAKSTWVVYKMLYCRYYQFLTP